jgi:hypothetical protein
MRIGITQQVLCRINQENLHLIETMSVHAAVL